MTDDNSNAIIPFGEMEPEDNGNGVQERAPHRLQFLVVETGDVVEKPAHSPLVVGRRGAAKRVDVDLTSFGAHEMGVSRHHIRVEPHGERIMVKDLDSVNGSRLNGEQMKPNYVYELHHGDVVKVGRMHLKVYFISLPELTG
jgi:pSer/pThr/pTyr-binding forkhead associated (FHA) protein